MSTSIALVTCAEVSSERRMCSAMPLRIAVIGSNALAGLRLRLGGSRRSGRSGRRRLRGCGCGRRRSHRRGWLEAQRARRAARGLRRGCLDAVRGAGGGAAAAGAGSRRGLGCGANGLGLALELAARFGLPTALDERQDVLLGHAAAGPGPRHGVRVDAMLGRDPGDDR